MSSKVNSQPILVGVLATVLAVILFVTLIRDAGSSESGLDSSQDVGFVESELVPEPDREWQVPENPRNPFVGPFSSQSGLADPEPEEPVPVSAQEAGSE